jgi:hypothetical protein
MGVALWFQQPILLCPSTNYQRCSEAEACLAKDFIFSEESPHSLSTKLGLVCEDKFYSRVFTSCFFFGNFLCCVFNVLVTLPKRRRKMIVASFALVNCMANFMLIIFYQVFYFFLGFMMFEIIIELQIFL